MQIGKEALVLHVHLVGVHVHHSAPVLHFDVPGHVISSVCEWLRLTSTPPTLSLQQMRGVCMGVVSARQETFVRRRRKSAICRHLRSWNACHGRPMPHNSNYPELRNTVNTANS